MSDKEQIEAFYDELDKVVKRFTAEFEIKVSTAIGVLEMIKMRLYKEQVDANEDD